MERSLSPREIQARIRAGASIDEVADESGAPAERISVFASPVMAEREHIARTALGATVRRRGDGAAHRRLREIISERLRARSIDPDLVSWDAWREPDLRWRVVGTLNHEDNKRTAEFLFDQKARFSVTANTDARWIIGEDFGDPGDPDSENTVDFDDELALVRATQDVRQEPPSVPGDDVPMREDPESPQTSELDDLYDMLSGVSEDSVRIYVGLDDEAEPASDAESEPEPDEGSDDDSADEDSVDDINDEGSVDESSDEVEFSSEQEVSDLVEDLLREDEEPSQPEQITEPQQDSLIEADAVEEPAPKKTRRKRAQVPSWDEIMFGGPSSK